MTSTYIDRTNFADERAPPTKKIRERIASAPLKKTFSDSSRQFSGVAAKRKSRFQDEYVGVYPGSQYPGEVDINKEPRSYQNIKFEDDNVRFLATGERKRTSHINDRLKPGFELATQRIQRLNTFPDGYPRNGVIADLNLEKMQNEEFKNAIGQLVQDFRNLPANIAAVLPAVAPGIAPAVAPGIAPAVAPVIAPAVAPGIGPAVAPPVRPVVAPVSAPAVPPPVGGAAPPPPAPPAPAPGSAPAGKIVNISADEQKEFEGIVSDPADLANWESYIDNLKNDLKGKIDKLEAKSDPVNPKAKALLKTLEEIDFTAINALVASGSNDMSKLPKAVQAALQKQFNYEAERAKNKGKMPFDIGMPKAPSKQAVAQGNMMSELQAKIAKRRGSIKQPTPPASASATPSPPKKTPSVASTAAPAPTPASATPPKPAKKTPSAASTPSKSSGKSIVQSAVSFGKNLLGIGGGSESKESAPPKVSEAEVQYLIDKLTRYEAPTEAEYAMISKLTNKPVKTLKETVATGMYGFTDIAVDLGDVVQEIRNASSSAPSTGMQAVLDLYAADPRPAAQLSYEDADYGRKLDNMLKVLLDEDVLRAITPNEAIKLLDQLDADYKSPDDYRSNAKKNRVKVETLLWGRAADMKVNKNYLDIVRNADAANLKSKKKGSVGDFRSSFEKIVKQEREKKSQN